MSRKKGSVNVKPKRKQFAETVIDAETRKILDDPKGWITGTDKPMVKTGRTKKASKAKVQPKTKRTRKKKDVTTEDIVPEGNTTYSPSNAGVT